MKNKLQVNYKKMNIVRLHKSACNSVHSKKTSPQHMSSAMKRLEANNRRKKLTNISKSYQN